MFLSRNSGLSSEEGFLRCWWESNQVMLKFSKSSLMTLSGIYDTKILKTDHFLTLMNVNFLAETEVQCLNMI